MAAETAPLKGRKMKGNAGGRFLDVLEAARLLGASSVPEKVIENMLDRLCKRLGKRTRCILLEGEDLKLRFWAGSHACPLEGVKVAKGSVVWDAVRRGVPVNLTHVRQTNGYEHSLSQPIKIKSVIPLMYSDPITGQPKKLGALIVDSGQAGEPISEEDFEYLQVIGELISAILGRAELIRQLMTSCRRQEAILMETAHNFRNSIAVIGGFALRVAQLAVDTELAEKATHLHEEVKRLEGHVAVFEKYMSLKL